MWQFCFGNLHIVFICLVATKVIKPDSNIHILLPSRHICPQLKEKHNKILFLNLYNSSIQENVSALKTGWKHRGEFHHIIKQDG